MASTCNGGQDGSCKDQCLVTRAEFDAKPNLLPGNVCRDCGHKYGCHPAGELQGQGGAAASGVSALVLKQLNLLVMRDLDPYGSLAAAPSRASLTLQAQDVCKYYNIHQKYCQALQMRVPASGVRSEPLVVNAHLWPASTHGKGLELLGLDPSDLTNPRNFLRLHRDVEQAFDKRRLCFICRDGQIVCKILDPSLLTSKIKNTPFCFHHLDGFPLDVNGHKRAPFHRVLANHAALSRRFALQQRWIDDPAAAVRDEELAATMRSSLGEDEVKEWLLQVTLG